MLPDFPSLKDEVLKIISAKLRQRVDTGDPVLAELRKFTQHEGTQMKYAAHGGETHQEGAEGIGAHFEVAITDVPDLFGEKLDAKLEEIAQELISQSARVFFKKLAESCEKAGTSFDGGGKPVSPEMLLEMESRMQVEFRSDGRPSHSIIIHPDMFPAVKKVTEEIENDPELKRRRTEILKRQREAWVARESNRKLVD
jgi:hypothetical protein